MATQSICDSCKVVAPNSGTRPYTIGRVYVEAFTPNHELRGIDLCIPCREKLWDYLGFKSEGRSV